MPEKTKMEEEDVTPKNAMSFFKQMAQTSEPAVPKSVSSAAAMFGGQLKPRTVSRGDSNKPASLAAMETRKSVVRDRSASRERRGISIERTRTRGESRERRHRGESGDRRRDRSEDRRSTAMSIRRTESRSRRDPSGDRTKPRIEREISLGIDSKYSFQDVFFFTTELHVTVGIYKLCNIRVFKLLLNYY